MNPSQRVRRIMVFSIVVAIMASIVYLYLSMVAIDSAPPTP